MGNKSKLVNSRKVREVIKNKESNKKVSEKFVTGLEEAVKNLIEQAIKRSDLAGRKVMIRRDA